MARSMVKAHPNSVGPSGNLNVRSDSSADIRCCLSNVRSAPNIVTSWKTLRLVTLRTTSRPKNWCSLQ